MGVIRLRRGIRKTFNARVVYLAFAWIFGLIAGTYSVNIATVTTASDIRIMTDHSLIGLILSFSLPLVLSFICIRFICFGAVIPVVVFKAFSFACSLCYIAHIYGNAGWLVCGLALFTDSLIIMLLIMQWFNAAIGKRYDLRQYLVIFAFLPILIGLFDYFVVSPFLAMLLNY